MLDFGKPMLDAVLAAAHVKHMGHVPGRWAIRVARRKRELNAVFGEHGVNFVRNGFYQRRQEGGGGRSAGLLHKLYEGELAGPVDRNIYSLPSPFGLRQLLLARLVAFDFRQPRNAMTLQATVQRWRTARPRGPTFAI
jgi:hypothetical protein